MSDKDHKDLEADTEELEDSAVSDSEWNKRVLCSDGNCIGVIGPDGRCKECGKPYEGRLPDQFRQESSRRENVPSAEAVETVSAEARAQSPSEPTDKGPQTESDSEASSWENRVLCSDGNCIGVIGPDGRCKECGRPYEPEKEEP